MVDAAYLDEGFYVGFSRQRGSDFEVREQLCLGTNFERNNRGETGGSYSNWIRFMMDLDTEGGFSFSLMSGLFVR